MFVDTNQTTLSSMFNLVALTDCKRFIIDKNGNLTAALLLHTSIGDGLDKDKYNQLFNIRKKAFEMIDDHYYISIHSKRSLSQYNEKSNISHNIIRALTNLKNQEFKDNYTTKHYLIITTKDKKTLAKTIAKQQQLDINKLDALENTVNDLIARLHEYNLKIIDSSDLISYWVSILNGRDMIVKTDDYLFDKYITDTDIHFPDNENYFTYKQDSKRYSCFLSIKSYPSETTQNLFKELQKMPMSFNIYQHYSTESRFDSIKELKERIGRLSNIKFNADALLQSEALLENVENDKIKFFKQVWNIQLTANTLEQLNQDALLIRNIIERRNLILLRETKNTEACFWSIFPTYEKMRIRRYTITSNNLPHFVTFTSDNQGLDCSTWGNSSVCKFLTDSNVLYDFSFHTNSNKQAIGNTVVIGGSGLGKTTLITYLLSQCMRFKDFKCMAFDRGLGMKVFADITDSPYMDFTGTTQKINPLHLDKKYINFLQNWLKDLLGRSEDEDIEMIDNGLKLIYDLPKKDRTLVNIAPSFGRKGKGSIKNALNLWLPDGANGAYFNGKTDALNFHSQFSFFDTTTILDNPDVLGAVADYLFFRFKTAFLDTPSSGAIFIDEFPKFLKSPQFIPKVKETAAEIRKTNAILIIAAQTPKVLFDDHNFQEMKENFSTYILFPNPSAEAKYYKEQILLNDEEFEWIKTAGGRQVMIKKTDTQTVILNIDLSSIGKFIKVFDSSSSTVNKVNKLQKKHPKDWKDFYINS